MRFDDFEVAHNPTFVTKPGVVVGAVCGGVHARDRSRLIREKLERREILLHFAKRDEHLLAILGSGFVECAAGAGEVGLVPSTGEDRERKARPEGPDAAVPVEERVELGAGVARRSGETQDGEERSLRDADAGVGGGQLALGGGDVGTALQQFRRQRAGHRWQSLRRIAQRGDGKLRRRRAGENRERDLE